MSTDLTKYVFKVRVSSFILGYHITVAIPGEKKYYMQNKMALTRLRFENELSL